MRLLAVAAAVLLLAVPALAETNVGVTAAVNQSANGTLGSNVRTISLGDSVLYNERIQTGGDGLVQILLADGTTFMVGPNSDLVIDSFVYDPNAGTAQVTASFTKGVLRFIGGQTSKTEGGVTLNTPVGTMGIRGAMVDVVLDPPAGTPQHIDMLFGNEVTLEQGQQLLGRLYAAGYSLVLGQGGAFEVMKTPPGWGSQIQAALAGKPGTKGGAPKGPTEEEVENSEFAENNQPDDPPGLSDKELNALLEAAATYDELRDFILNNQSPQGFVGGMIVGQTTCEEDENCVTPNLPGINDFRVTFDGEGGLATYTPTYADLAFDMNGNPVRIKASFLADSPECEDECNAITYEGGPNGGRLTINGQEVPTAQDLLFAHDDPREDNPLNQSLDPDYPEYTLADQLDCDDCGNFIKWGFWGFEADTGLSGPEGHVEYLGTWVTGDLTTRAQMANLAEQSEGVGIDATYSGDAVGVVYNENVGSGTYVATGDLDMSWNFGQRAGVVEISGFDSEHLNDGLGMDIEYGVTGPSDGGNGFIGAVTGEGYYGYAQGAFVNDGSDVAAGVIGNWAYTQDSYFDPDGDYPGYAVSGVFMGTMDTE